MHYHLSGVPFVGKSFSYRSQVYRITDVEEKTSEGVEGKLTLATMCPGCRRPFNFSIHKTEFRPDNWCEDCDV